MDSDQGGPSSAERQRQTAAEIARKKVLAAYSSATKKLHQTKSRYLPPSSKDILVKNRTKKSATKYTTVTTTSTAAFSSTNHTTPPSADHTTPLVQTPSTHSAQSQQPTTPANPGQSPVLKDATIDPQNLSPEWQKYHSAWQNYYQNYYNNYYSQAAEAYLATAKMKDERIATGSVRRHRNLRKFIPLIALGVVILVALFLQYNRLIFAPIMAYIVPDTGSVTTSLEAVDPSITQTVSADPRLIIPKLNIDVPVAFNISLDDVMSAMNYGVAHYSIPGANALPGQIGNLVITGHSAGDIYSSNPYKFIFSGLERLESGDLIYVNYESTRYTYQVTKKETIEPTNVQALIYETDKPMLTLVTCTPLGTSRYRLLVTAEQISPAYSSDNVAESAPSEPTTEESTLPSNEPSFFENLWQSIFGN